MPWMIKSRGRLLHLRDGKEPSDPLYIVDDVREYPFRSIPVGIDSRNDSDVLCREVDSIEGVKPAQTYAESLVKKPVTANGDAPAESTVITKVKPKVRAG